MGSREMGFERGIPANIECVHIAQWGLRNPGHSSSLETCWFVGVPRAELAWEFLTQWSNLANILYYESADIIVKVQMKHVRSQNI